MGDPLAYPLPPYLANLVVSENWANMGLLTDRKVLEAIYAPLRPYGGTACVSLPAAERDSLVKQVADRQLVGAAVKPVGDWVLLSRDGPLPGSADWTHAEADPAGTGASEDLFVRPPFELLWFDTPKRWFRTPGSAMARVCGGRLLIKSDKLQAVNVYTGRPLWEASLPFPATPNDQFVTLDDAIYVSGGVTCLVLDPATGHKSGQIDLPAGLTAAWSNLRAWQDYLVGQSGKHLVCLDRHSGQLKWKYECGRPALSIAVGGGKVFCAELVNKLRGETDRDGATRALALDTGKLLWQVPGGSEVRYSSSADLVVTSAGIYRAQDGTLAAAVPQPPPADPKIPPQNLPRPLFVVGGKMLFGTAENLTHVRLAYGGQGGRSVCLGAPRMHDSAGQLASDHDPSSGQRRVHRLGDARHRSLVERARCLQQQFIPGRRGAERTQHDRRLYVQLHAGLARTGAGSGDSTLVRCAVISGLGGLV